MSTLRIALLAAAAAAVAALLGGCAAQQAYSRGMEYAARGETERALAEFDQAMRLDPTNARYRVDYLNQQARLVAAAVERANAARVAGDAAAAREQFALALKYDPVNEPVRRALAALDDEQRQRAAIAEADKIAAGGNLEAARDRLRLAAAEAPANKEVTRALAQMQERIDQAAADKDARNAAASVMKKPVTLQFRDANVRMVFEALSRTTGLNVILDRDVRADLKTTIFVRDASVEDTVDLILLQNQLDKKVLNANTLFIYPATAAKQKEYQDLRVRTFQLSNVDAKYMQNVLKTILKIKDVAIDERTNTLVIRDTPDAIAVAEKLVLANDMADAEVMLEVQVLEVSRDRLTNLGIAWPGGVTLATPDSASTVGGLRALTFNQLQISALQASINAQLQTSEANLLASPRLRARSKEKAKILIGDKVPVITNSVTPVQSGSAVVTGSIQYIDVGIKLEVEPNVYLDSDIGIKLNLEVSNIVQTIKDDKSGSLAYQIGTRNASTSLRLHDGETQILGGLISDEDRRSASKVPGLGELPLLGHLFGSENRDRTKKEIILSITPHIVRAQAVADGRYRNMYSGSESAMRENPLRLDPVGAAGAMPVAITAPSRPVVPAAAPNVPVAQPHPAAPPAAPAPLPLPVPAAPASSGGAARDFELTLQGPASAKLGREFQVSVMVKADRDLPALPLAIRFDPLVVTYLDAELADFGSASGASLETVVDRAGGTVRIEVKGNPALSLHGQGALLNLHFAGRVPREQTRVAVARFELKDAAGASALVAPEPLTLRVGN